MSAARHLQPRGRGARGGFQRSADVVGDDVLGLELRPRLSLLPPVEDVLHQPGQPHQRLRPFLAERFGPGIAGAVAPGADVELVERIGARRLRGRHPCVAGDLAERTRPVVLLFLDESERRVLDRDHAGDVRHALRDHEHHRSACRMAGEIDREFAGREMPAHGVLHAGLERRRPRRHAVVEDRAGLRARHRAGAVAHAHGGVAHHLVLVRRDALALEPDRRAYGALGVDGVARPVTRRIVEIKPAGKRHRHGLAAEFLGEEFRHRLHRFVVAGATVEQEDADLQAISAARDLRRGRGLVDGDAHVPVEPKRLDAEDVLGLPHRQVRPRQHGIRARQRLFARDALRRLPIAALWGDVHRIARHSGAPRSGEPGIHSLGRGFGLLPSDDRHIIRPMSRRDNRVSIGVAGIEFGMTDR